METGLVELIKQGEFYHQDFPECPSHNCFIRKGYISFQKDALEYVTENITNTLTRLRGHKVDSSEARDILLNGKESEFDGLLEAGGSELDAFRNIGSVAIGYAAGHCGYTCPDRGGCRLAQLWVTKPNYLQDLNENPNQLNEVLYDFCHDIGLSLVDDKEKDAIMRWIEEHKYLKSQAVHHDIGLKNAEKDFVSRFNKFFLDLGFKLGCSEEYAACKREKFLEEQWMQEVHGASACSD